MVAATLQRCTADSSPSLHISSDLALAAVVTRKEKKKFSFATSLSLSRHHPTPHLSALRGQSVCGGEDENSKKKKRKEKLLPAIQYRKRKNLLPPLLETKNAAGSGSGMRSSVPYEKITPPFSFSCEAVFWMYQTCDHAACCFPVM